MSFINKRNITSLRKSLQVAVVQCSERGLYQSAKWAAELTSSLPSFESSSQSYETEGDSFMQDAETVTAHASIFSTSLDSEESLREFREHSQFLLAKSFFDCREFDRCAAVFLTTEGSSKDSGSADSNSTANLSLPSRSKGKSKESTTGASSQQTNRATNESRQDRLSQRSLFLALYAKFMAGEKRKEESSEMILGPADNKSSINKEVFEIKTILETWVHKKHSVQPTNKSPSQGYLEYLYGVVLISSKSEDEAKRWLLKSIEIAPYNWGAWLELSSLLNNAEELEDLLPLLPTHLMTLMFQIYSSQELYQSSEAVHQGLNEMEEIFPKSDFLKTQRALLYYHSKDFEEAESIFAGLLRSSPYRLDSLDNYSNILYVMANRPKLAYLAQVTTATDKFRPETCCIVGNYYSLKSEHERAVMYFRRALTLDRSFLSAWTLMGHEYVEVKNTHAAIESYRRAVDVNRKDYRAWYGLGQTYEVLEMNFYALFYFQRAASLRPTDPKMWQAIGQCYDRIDRPVESIKAYKRALMVGSYYDTDNSSVPFSSSVSSSTGAHGSFSHLSNAQRSSAIQPSSQAMIMDPEILYQIALMYEKLEQPTEAASYMELTLAQEEGDTGVALGGGPDGTPTQDNDETATHVSTNEVPPLINAGESATNSGVGVTNTTSRARMWLARYEFAQRNLHRAMELVNELCQDGVEVEEAKALSRDIRARMESDEAT